MSFRALPRLGPALLLTLMALSVGFTATTSAMRRSQGQWVSHTVRVLAKIERVRVAQAEVRYRERNVVLGGGAEDRKGHADAIRTVDAALREVRLLIADNPDQRALLGRSEGAWTVYSRESEALVGSVAPMRDRIALTMAKAHRSLFGQVGDALEEMRTEEERLLAVREASLARTYALFNGAIIGTALVMGLSFLLLARLAREERRTRKQADDALSAEKAALEGARLRLENLAEAAFEGIAITQDGHVVDSNSAFTAMFGYGSVDELKGVRAELFAAPESRDVVIRKRAALDEEPYEAILLRRDGSTFPAELRGRRIEVGGRLARVTAVHDLSAQKAAERGLRESAARLAEAQRVARLGSWAWEIASGRISWSDELFRLFEIDPAEGEPEFSEMLRRHHPADVAVLMDAIDGAVREGRPYEIEIRVVQRDGSYRWMRAVGQSERDASGGVVGLFGTLMDVHARKTQDEELHERTERLRQSEAALQAILQAAPVVLFAADAAGTITLFKGAERSALGVDPRQALGRSVFDLGPDVESAEALRRALAGETVSFESWHGEVCLQKEVRPLAGPAGEPAGVIGVAVDVTERKRAELALRESGKRLALATEAASGGVWDLDVAEGRLHWDERMYALFGVEPEFGGDLFAAFAGALHPDDRERVIADAKAAVRTGEALTGEFRVVLPDGTVRHIESHAIAETGEGGVGVARIIGINRDVTERREAEIERQRSEERFRVLFERSSDAHLLFDESGIIDCNPAAIGLLRCADASEVLSIHPAVLSPEFQPDGRRSDEKSIEMDALARKNGLHRFEWIHRKSDGENFPVEVSLTPVTLEGRPVLLVVWHDLTEIKAAERKVAAYAALMEEQRDRLEATNAALIEQEGLSARRLAETTEMNALLEAQRHQLNAANERLSALATTDGLTGLTNQRTFRERLAEECAQAWRHGRDLSLLVLDVDRFKSYNDSFGHPAGDGALRKVADVLKGEAREYDIAARNGGEEFALLLPGTDAAGAASVAERVRQAVEAEAWPLRPVTVSVGLATLRPSFVSLDEFIEAADRALYAAKEGGRNRVVVAEAHNPDRPAPGAPAPGTPASETSLYPVPANEAERLVALAETGLFGSSPEEAYDTLAETAALIFGVPIALVSLVGLDSQWLKARVGLEVASTDRDISFCTHTILGDGPMVVEDATIDPRFAESTLVTGDPSIRFYAGAPIRTADGLALGALCAIDRVPRTPTEAQLRLLERLARQAARLMDIDRALATFGRDDAP